MVFYNTLLFGILIASGCAIRHILKTSYSQYENTEVSVKKNDAASKSVIAMLPPATAWFKFPRTRISNESERTFKNYIHSYNSRNPIKEYKSYEEDDEIYRRRDKIYIITVDSNSQLLKKLESLPLQNINQDSHELEWPMKKKIAVLPLITFENSDEEIDISKIKNLKAKSQLSSNQWAKLLDNNAMSYLNRKDRLKNSLRNEAIDPQLDQLNRVSNVQLPGEGRDELPLGPTMYNFSDLVL